MPGATISAFPLSLEDDDMAASETVVQFPKPRTRLVCSQCGAKGEMGCGCGVEYIRAADFAAKVVADPANAEKSTRDLADATGLSNFTISKARQKSGVRNLTPNARVKGSDGKSYMAHKPKRAAAPKRHYAASEIMALHDVGKSNKEIAAEIGKSERQVRHVVDDERIRRDAVTSAVTIDIDTLSPTANEKLAAAIRQEKRRLEVEYAARMQGIEEEVRLRVVAEGKEYLAMIKEREAKVYKSEQFWQSVANDHKPLFTVDQFKTILMCLHPDGQRTEDKLAEAFRLFKDKQVQLTGKRG
jgi:hypothetical protein